MDLKIKGRRQSGGGVVSLVARMSIIKIEVEVEVEAEIEDMVGRREFGF